MTKNKEQNSEFKKTLAKMTNEQKEFLARAIVAEEVYETVITQLNIDDGDEVYQNLTVGVLKRQTRDHMVLYIWENLDDEQLKHFNDFLNQSSLTYPEKPHDEVLIEFALMYPELMENVYKSLSKFFKDFIKNFNEISES